MQKKEPDTYRQIRQIMQERQMMEAQMEAAETKEEVAAIRLNEITKIEATMGEGEQAGCTGRNDDGKSEPDGFCL